MILQKHQIKSIMGAALAALALGGTILTATAQGASYDNPPSNSNSGDRSMGKTDKSTLNHSDRHFIEKAAKMNQEEVAISRLVAQNGASPQVRAFATEMVSAHEKVATELSTVAAKKGVAVDTENVNTKKWTESKPAEIDEDYVKKMVSEHKTLIDLFEKAAKSDDADIAGFANSYLPDLRTHYTKAESLKTQIKS